MRKKKEEVVVADSELPEKPVVVDINRNFITPLELSIDLGRNDLNQVVEQLQNKLNEVIRKTNT